MILGLGKGQKAKTKRDVNSICYLQERFRVYTYNVTLTTVLIVTQKGTRCQRTHTKYILSVRNLILILGVTKTV